MNVEKREVRAVNYQLTLSAREMAILASVAYHTAGRGDARFLYDLGSLVGEDIDHDDLDTSDIDISFVDFDSDTDEELSESVGMVIETGVNQ